MKTNLDIPYNIKIDNHRSQNMEIVILWIVLGIVSAIVAANKGRSGCGWFAIGVLLGPIGLIMAFVVSKNEKKIEKKAIQDGTMKKCPYCAEMIKVEAVKCRYCGTEIKEANLQRPQDRT